MSNLQPVDLQLSDGEDRAGVYATDDLEVRRVRLAPGEALPPHHANSHVLLVPLAGTIAVAAGAEQLSARLGGAISVAFQTRMEVSNQGAGPCVFLVLKTPHPRRMPAQQA